jgi:hypothetical protein
MSDQASTYPPHDELLAQSARRNPPRLHWALVLIFSLLTLGLFSYIWFFVQARWVKRVQGMSYAYGWTILCIVLWSVSLLDYLSRLVADNWSSSSRYLEGLLAGVYLVSIFALQQELEEAIPGMRLSGAMTFFFGPVYFQYHLQRFQAPN